MNLSELIDLEVQLLRDEQAATDGGDRPADRDRAIGLRVAEELGFPPAEAAPRLARRRAFRHRVCAVWLRELPAATRATLPGSKIVSRYRLAAWLLLAVFFFAGIGTALAALHGTDDKPINVLVFIVIFFVLQILLLALYPFLMLIRRLRGGGVGPWLQGVVVRLSRIRLLDRLTGSSVAELPGALQQLRARQSVYAAVQNWTLFGLVQRMGTAFNLAALLATLYMVTFHDLANCCWSTTLRVEDAELHRWLGWIATPWSWLDSAGPPSRDAIHYSRWVTSDASGYLTVPPRVDAPALRRTWWPFLIAGLVTWGLLPRALAFVTGAYLARRAGERVPLTHMAVQHLFERLFPPAATWSGPAPDEVRGAGPAAPATPVRPRPPPQPQPRLEATADAYLVCWGTLFGAGDAAAAHVAERFHRRIEGTFAAGLADVDAERRTVAALRRAKARRVVLALPEGQQPTKDVMRFLAELRDVLGPDCEIVVGLLAEAAGGFGDVDADEMATWRERLLAEADPYLSLQRMGAGR